MKDTCTVDGSYFDDGQPHMVHDGQKLSFRIQDSYISDAEICIVPTGGVFILQNVWDGHPLADKRGYLFSWKLDDAVTGIILEKEAPIQSERPVHPIHQLCTRIMFHGPAIIVFWKDGTKTVSVTHEPDGDMDVELGFMIAYYKKTSTLTPTQTHKLIDSIWRASPIAVINGDKVTTYVDKHDYLRKHFMATTGFNNNDTERVTKKIRNMHARYVVSLEKKLQHEKATTEKKTAPEKKAPAKKAKTEKKK